MPIERSYRRDADAQYNYEDTGWDLALDPNQGYDIQQSRAGDFIVVDGANAIIHSLIRRALTPIGGAARLIKGSQGWEAIDTDFGNELAFFLSQPTPNLSSAEDAVWACVKEDDRVEVLQVKASRTDSNEITVDIRYRLASQSQIQEASLTLG